MKNNNNCYTYNLFTSSLQLIQIINFKRSATNSTSIH